MDGRAENKRMGEDRRRKGMVERIGKDGRR
jgi:hypothetical protein